MRVCFAKMAESKVKLDRWLTLSAVLGRSIGPFSVYFVLRRLCLDRCSTYIGESFSLGPVGGHVTFHNTTHRLLFNNNNMDPPTKNADYREERYWDTRYTTEDSYDWFTGYSAFKHLILQHVNPSDSILMLGCGNSALSEDMYNDGIKNIVNTDFSSVIIDKMAAKHADKPEMTWEVMDVTDMQQFGADTFDVILEKGTLDALLVHERDPWNLSEESLTVIDKVLTQVTRLMKPDGKFISITFSQPHFRRPLMARSKYNWSVNMDLFGDTFHFFFFWTIKGQSLSENDKAAEMERERKKLAATNDSCLPPRFLEATDNEDCFLGMEV